jgi:hypothetical protein
MIGQRHKQGNENHDLIRLRQIVLRTEQLHIFCRLVIASPAFSFWGEAIWSPRCPEEDQIASASFDFAQDASQ